MTPADDDRRIRATVEVPAPRSDVWTTWTTAAGLETFFAPESSVDPRPGGSFELYFDPDAPPGKRGSDGCEVLAVQPERMLSFSWNAPTQFPAVREQRTSVVVRLHDLDEDRTRVTLVHSGFGTSDEWDRALAYFEDAWSDVVLSNLRRRFEEGPIDWDDR